MPEDSRPILICFDDSEPSHNAIAEAARLFPGSRAVVLHVWRSIESTPAYRYSAAGLTGALREAMDELETAGREAAAGEAAKGVKLAREAGLEAEALVVEAKEHTDSIVAEQADRLDARLVVMGSRRLGAIQAMALGGFSAGALHRATRPVLVVPFHSSHPGS
ncbi:MAG TPA: universal stress protein [Thermoleophilaceae bacterium]